MCKKVLKENHYLSGVYEARDGVFVIVGTQRFSTKGVDRGGKIICIGQEKAKCFRKNCNWVEASPSAEEPRRSRRICVDGNVI